MITEFDLLSSALNQGYVQSTEQELVQLNFNKTISLEMRDRENRAVGDCMDEPVSNIQIVPNFCSVILGELILVKCVWHGLCAE